MKIFLSNLDVSPGVLCVSPLSPAATTVGAGLANDNVSTKYVGFGGFAAGARDRLIKPVDATTVDNEDRGLVGEKDRWRFSARAVPEMPPRSRGGREACERAGNADSRGEEVDDMLRRVG